MITVNENYHNLDISSQIFNLRGFCISELTLDGKLEIIFQKGIGVTLTQKIIDLYTEKIITKRQGYINENIGTLTIYMHFFERKPEKRLIIIYIDKIDNELYQTLLPIKKNL